MFKKKEKFWYEVVPENEYTDFSDRIEEKKADNLLVGASAMTAAIALTTYGLTKTTSAIPVSASTLIDPTLSTSTNLTPVYMSNPDIIPTGYFADATLNTLATILDPVVQILVAISFPIASVVMIGACFFFMFGNSEKAWNMIMNAGLGYVLIQMSPLFLSILREIGKAI